MKNKKVTKRAIKKSIHEILKEDAIEDENEKMIDDESERENIKEERVDEMDFGDDNSHLEYQEQDEEEDQL